MVSGTIWYLATLCLVFPVMAQQDISKVYKGGERNREYIVHLPPGYVNTKEYPLVMVLHGCNQDNKVIKKDTDFDRIANEEGVIAVYPFITSYSGLRNTNCWGFWFANEIKRGAGEVGDLNGIVQEVSKDYSVDSNRIHIMGLSSGGAMTTVAGVAYPDVFASIAPAAGVGYGETASCVTSSCFTGPTVLTVANMASKTNAQMGVNKRRLPVLVLHSTSDCVVQILNGQRIRDSIGVVFGARTTTPTLTETGVVKGAKYTKNVYNDEEGPLIQTHWVDGIAHGWVGGVQGQYSFPNGPDWSLIAWEFFKANPKNKLERAVVSILGSSSPAPNCIQVTGKFTDPNSQVDEVLVRLEGLRPVSASPAELTGLEFKYSRCSLGDDTYYTAVAYAVDPTGKVLSVESPGTPVAIGNPPPAKPTLLLDSPIVDKLCVTLTGIVKGESHLVVETRLDAGVVPSEWKNVDVWDGATGKFSARYCELAVGQYVSEARATDQQNLTVTGFFADFTIKPNNYDQQATDTLTNHVATQRVATYQQSNCLGFGTCDTIYNTLFSRYGSSTSFTVYRQTGTNIWFEKPDNIPSNAKLNYNASKPLTSVH